MKLAFLVAPEDPAFLTDIFSAVATRAAQLGVDASIHSGPAEALDELTIPVVSWRRLALRERALREIWERTVLFGIEELGFCIPGSGPKLGHRFELSRHVVRSSRFNGVAADWFDPPYASEWEPRDRAGSSPQRYLLCPLEADSRANNTVARLSVELSELGAAFHSVCPKPDLVADARNSHERRRLLSESQAVLIPRGRVGSALPRVRALEAIANGSVPISVAGGDWGFLRSGQHVLLANEPYLGAVVRAGAADPQRLARMAADAREVAIAQTESNDSVGRLCAVAADLLPERRSHGRSRQPLSTTTDPKAERHVRKQLESARWLPEPVALPVDPGERDLDDWLPASVRRELAEQAAIPEPAWRPRDPWPLSSPTTDDAIDVICVRHPRSGPLENTALSLAEAGTAATLHIGEAVSSGVSEPAAGAARSERANEAVTVGRARNRLLAESEAPYVLIVDAGDQVCPGMLGQLLDCLQRDPAAALATAVCAHGTSALTNALAPQVDLLNEHAYLARGYLIRRSWLERLGGFADDEEFDFLVDHELWVQTAQRGGKVLQLSSLGVQLWFQDAPE